MSFWENVKKEISRQNTKQEWVADQIGMDRGAFRSAISKKQEPMLGKAIKIAKVLNVTVEYLYDGTDTQLSLEDRSVLDLARKYAEVLDNLESMNRADADAFIRQIKLVASAENKKTTNFTIVTPDDTLRMGEDGLRHGYRSKKTISEAIDARCKPDNFKNDSEKIDVKNNKG